MADRQFVVKRDMILSLVDEPKNLVPEVLTEPRLLLPWSEIGLLTFNEIKMTPTQLMESPLITGLGMGFESWSSDQREKIAKELIKRLRSLALLGCQDIVVSGEFVEQIVEPTCAEGYFHIDGVSFPPARLQDYLSTVEPTLSWPWSSGFSGEPVRLYPVFCYKEGNQDIHVYSAPKEHFHENSEGLSKGVVRLILR